MTDQEQQLQAMQAMIAELTGKMQAQAQPTKATGYGDAQALPQAATSDLVTVTLPFSCQRSGKWLNWTEEYSIPDGADAFNALLDRIEAKGKPLSLRGATAAGGGYGKK
jgi:hypothetical protein